TQGFRPVGGPRLASHCRGSENGTDRDFETAPQDIPTLLRGGPGALWGLSRNRAPLPIWGADLQSPGPRTARKESPNHVDGGPPGALRARSVDPSRSLDRRPARAPRLRVRRLPARHASAVRGGAAGDAG